MTLRRRTMSRSVSLGAAAALAAGVAVGAGVGVGVRPASASLPITIKAGQKLEDVAIERYGDASIAALLRAAYGFPPKTNPPAGMTIVLPDATPHRLAPADTWVSLAGARLGDPRRAAVLARGNGFDAAKPMPPPGTTVWLPFVVRHLAYDGETYKSIATAFYADGRKADTLRAYNLLAKTAKTPRPGETVLVPIFHARLKTTVASVPAAPAATAAPAAATAAADPGGVTSAATAAAAVGETAAPTSGVATAKAGAKPAAPPAPPLPSDALLDAALVRWAEGEYARVVAALAPALERPEDWTGPVACRKAEVLGGAYVALAEESAALEVFRRLYERCPEWKPDEKRTSPKILRVLESARAPKAPK